MHEPEKWGYVYFSSKGIGKDTFTISQDEKIRWKLFELHNKQKSWATILDSISKKPISVDNKILEPILENYSAGYTISIKSPFSNKTLILKEDGRIISN